MVRLISLSLCFLNLSALMLILHGCSPRAPSNAHYINQLSGISNVLLEGAVQEMEARSSEEFMHANALDADVIITYDWGDLPAGILGQAHPTTLGSCHVYFSELINPQSLHYSNSDFQQIVMHETAHCFWMEHTVATDQIMSAYFESNLYTVNPNAMDEFISALNRQRGR